ncbi:MAG: hypothetical protein Q9209_000730 [Squamulea sp. 1 TL-2023]
MTKRRRIEHAESATNGELFITSKHAPPIQSSQTSDSEIDDRSTPVHSHVTPQGYILRIKEEPDSEDGMSSVVRRSSSDSEEEAHARERTRLRALAPAIRRRVAAPPVDSDSNLFVRRRSSATSSITSRIVDNIGQPSPRCCIRCVKYLGQFGRNVECNARFGRYGHVVKCWRCQGSRQECIPVQEAARPAVDRAFALRNTIKEQEQQISSATMVRKAAQDELKYTVLHLNNPWDASIRRRLDKSARLSAIFQEYSELVKSIEFED